MGYAIDTGQVNEEIDVRARFAAFRDSPVERFRVSLRRVRAGQLRELLADPDRITLDEFNREVWAIHVPLYLRSEAVSYDELWNELCEKDPAGLTAALDNNELELHGNCMWGSGSGVYGAPLQESPDEKLALVRTGIRQRRASVGDRRRAVRDLADVLEAIRPEVKEQLLNDDERDLFMLANAFAVRHNNSKQKSGYDGAVWLAWMFHVNLAAVHLVLRLRDRDVGSVRLIT